jgi:regulator of nucleoside diphosphate kinase
MANRKFEMTEADARRIRELLASLEVTPQADRDAQRRLRDKLDHARIVASHRVGPGVVTLQSRVVLEDDETWERRTYRLVHPRSRRNGRDLSVLVPAGTAILGCREGDVVEYGGSAGRLRILKVLDQPERRAS